MEQVYGVNMDKLIEDYIFMEHFNPAREPDISGVTPCPFCGSRILGKSGDDLVCFRCNKKFSNKEREPHGN